MKKPISDDIYFMRKALSLAKRGLGQTHPNPLVGAVLVKDHRIIGSGFHQHFGAAHAEVNAVRSARQNVKDSTLYVTLEPCAHFGKTPPCVDLIKEKKISKVIVGVIDPNPLVSGKGIKLLKRSGIKVRTGVLKEECETLNRDFNYWMRKKMPYVIVKAAQSLDGKIATRTGDSHWITGKPARIFSHRLRAESDAILVGVNTVLRDDPLLNVRYHKTGQQPVKVILDSHLRVSPKAKIFSKDSPGPVIVAVTKPVSAKDKKSFRNKAEILKVKAKKGRVDLKALLSVLAKRGILRVMIEGGGEVIAEALKEKLVQEVYFFVAPKIIGGRQAKNSVAGEGIADLKDALKLKEMNVVSLGKDFLIHGKV